MTGNKLRDFAEKLPIDEREALKALCEPDWDYEIVWLKKGPDGILMCRSLYYAPFEIMPLYSNGEIRWLNDDEEYPEDMEILEDYKDIKPLYEEEMRPYRWRWDVTFGKINDVVEWLYEWLIQHDPDVVYLTKEDWYEREQVSKDLEHIVTRAKYPLSFYEDQLKKTRASTKDVQRKLHSS